jgi:hypothetical protein
MLDLSLESKGSLRGRWESEMLTRYNMVRSTKRSKENFIDAWNFFMSKERHVFMTMRQNTRYK